ncbi:C-terminal binding protein [Mycobacterium hodleri]|uniref:C-terminal binding protein n=1 Tax=Mycolicibacterium hodleri TaxID=49897 RepID=A0A544W7I0_9MYCO|nr:C-terminal binding protein [Mycolicibacterium hodleri]TQR88188.1 C-terminal binding protein [Mycolicibacterium hodleri]
MTENNDFVRPVDQDSDIGHIIVAPHQFIDLAQEQQLAEEFGIELLAAADKDEFRAGIPDASLVLVTPYARVEAADFAAMKRCRAVVRYGIGYDNIDVDAAREVGVPVAIVPDASSEEVAAHALAMGLALVRRIPGGHAAIANGGWAGKLAYDTPRFSELDVAVIGLGRIGRQVASYYSALGANVRGYDPFATFDGITAASLDELLEGSDLISLHVPLSAETENLVSADVLERMRPGAVLVNVSRGGLIDEHALSEALIAGRLAGAALDTFGTEPLPSDHPLRTAPNVVLTPHIAWRSNRALETLQASVVARCREALTGGALLNTVA